MQLFNIDNDLKFSNAKVPSGQVLMYFSKQGENSIGIRTMDQRGVIKSLINPEYVEYWNSKVSAPLNTLPELDGKNVTNVKPVTRFVELTGGVNASGVIWSEGNTKATIPHDMNCIPKVTLYDNQKNIVNNLNVRVVNANSFIINFLAAQTISNTYSCVIGYGVDYNQAPTVVSGSVATFVQQAETAKLQAQAAKFEAQQAAANAVAHSIQLQFSLNENQQLIMSKMAGTSFDFDINPSGQLMFIITM